MPASPASSGRDRGRGGGAVMVACAGDSGEPAQAEQAFQAPGRALVEAAPGAGG